MTTSKETIQELYAAFARGDAEAVLGMLHPSIDWNEAEGGPLAGGNPYTSPEAVGAGVFAPLIQDLEDFAATPERFVTEDGDVVALGRYTGTHKPSGRALDAQFAHHWSVEDGKIVAFQQYTDTAQWSDVFA